MRTQRFTRVLDGKDFRRLLVTSKGRLVEDAVFGLGHGTPPSRFVGALLTY